MNQYPKVFKDKYGKVTVYRSSRSGKWTTFKIRWRLGQKVFEEKRNSEEAALARAEEIFSQLSKGEEILSRADKDKIAYYATCEQMLGGKISLLELVRTYLKEEERMLGSADLDECITQYLKSMESRGLSRVHIVPVRSRLRKFQKSMPGNLLEITVKKATEYLESVENLTSRSNERRVLNRFFSWCRDQGILPQEQDHVIERTDAPKVKWAEPEIIKPEDMAKVLWIAKTGYPETVVPLVLGAFAGLRRAEITRLKMSNIDMEQGVIILPAEVTKTNQRRVIVINGTLRAWLEDYLRPDQDFDDPSFKYKVTRCVKYTKAFWPINGLRHSYVSYRVQNDRDVTATAHECGHSVEILNKHYRCLCTPAEAEKWFDILPETTNFDMLDSGVTPEKIVDA